MKIDWKQKLTSRKFWAAIIAFVTAVCAAFGIEQITTEQIIAIISAVSALIAYIIGEGLVDAAHSKATGNENTVQETDGAAQDDDSETGCL